MFGTGPRPSCNSTRRPPHAKSPHPRPKASLPRTPPPPPPPAFRIPHLSFHISPSPACPGHSSKNKQPTCCPSLLHIKPTGCPLHINTQPTHCPLLPDNPHSHPKNPMSQPVVPLLTRRQLHKQPTRCPSLSPLAPISASFPFRVSTPIDFPRPSCFHPTHIPIPAIPRHLPKGAPHGRRTNPQTGPSLCHHG